MTAYLPFLLEVVVSSGCYASCFDIVLVTRRPASLYVLVLIIDLTGQNQSVVRIGLEMTSRLLFVCLVFSFSQLSSCAETPARPGLSLQPETSSDTVNTNLRRGVQVKNVTNIVEIPGLPSPADIFPQDPFSALGLKSLKIVNKVQFCEDEANCEKITDFAPTEKNFLPQVLAFFVQTHENFTGKNN